MLDLDQDVLADADRVGEPSLRHASVFADRSNAPADRGAVHRAALAMTAKATAGVDDATSLGAAVIRCGPLPLAARIAGDCLPIVVCGIVTKIDGGSHAHGLPNRPLGISHSVVLAVALRDAPVRKRRESAKFVNWFGQRRPTFRSSIALDYDSPDTGLPPMAVPSGLAANAFLPVIEL
jgi:hypothetical protein